MNVEDVTLSPFNVVLLVFRFSSFILLIFVGVKMECDLYQTRRYIPDIVKKNDAAFFIFFFTFCFSFLSYPFVSYLDSFLLDDSRVSLKILLNFRNFFIHDNRRKNVRLISYDENKLRSLI